VEESVLCGGVLLRLIDTAGIRDTDDPVERLGVERSRKAVADADLALAVVDGSTALTTEDIAALELAARCEKWILVLSKKDLGESSAIGLMGLPSAPAATVTLSSVTGEGIDALEAAVAELFPAGDRQEAGSLPTDAWQEDAVTRALAAIRRAKAAFADGLTPDAILTDAEDALNALGELTGRTAREDIVSTIFSRFCVGK
jgi:tRNA modification GTPase